MTFFNSSVKRMLFLIVASLLIFAEAKAQLQAPTLVAPDSNATCLPLGVNFRWTLGANTTAVRLQVSTSPTILFPDITEVTLSSTSTSYSVTMPNMNTMYYWRVSATYTGGGVVTTNIRNFKTIGPSPVPSLPPDSSTCVPKSPIFQWSASPAATAYRLEVYNSTTFNTNTMVYQNYAISGSATTFTTVMPNNYTTYYWRISASFTNCVSDWAQVYNFKTIQINPTVVAPPNNATGVDMTTTLGWTVISPVSYYELQVSRASNFSSFLYNASELSSSTFSITLPVNDTIYYWRVRSVLNGCPSVWSSTYNFKTKYPTLTLSQPILGRICLPLKYRYEWNELVGITSYRLQIATDSNFTKLAVNQNNIRDSYYEATITAGLTKHYWRVRAEDAKNTGEWSVPRWFTSTIEQVVQNYPANNSGGIPKTCTFKWNQTEPGAKYHFQISKTANFADTIFNVGNISSTTYTVTLPNNNTDYYWRISASFSDCVNDFGPIWKFKTIIPSPVLTIPANNAVKVSFFSLLCKWNAVTDAETYTINISKTANFAQIDYGANGITQTNYLLTNLDPKTKYYWRVSAQNQFGSSDYSTPFSFTTIERGPDIPDIISPAIGAEKLPTSVTLKWTDAARATTFHLQVSVTQDFAARLVDENALDTNFYDLSGLNNDVTYYWRVSSINDSGETIWSKTANFRVIKLAPTGKAILVSPANNKPDESINVWCRWLDQDRATEYLFQLGTDAGFATSTLAFNDSVYVNQRFATGLLHDTKYYWRVKARNEAGSGDWSDTYTFTTEKGVSVDDMSEYGIKAAPNPFSEKFDLSFTTKSTELVKIRIYTTNGQEVSVLLNSTLTPGDYTVSWNAGGRENGVYYYRIQIGDKQTIGTITKIK